MLSHDSLDVVRRSVFGALEIYNLLPQDVVERHFSVSSFQGALQDLVLSRAIVGCDDWSVSLSNRIPSHAHPLR